MRAWPRERHSNLGGVGAVTAVVACPWRAHLLGRGAHAAHTALLVAAAPPPPPTHVLGLPCKAEPSAEDGSSPGLGRPVSSGRGFLRDSRKLASGFLVSPQVYPAQGHPAAPSLVSHFPRANVAFTHLATANSFFEISSRAKFASGGNARSPRNERNKNQQHSLETC